MINSKFFRSCLCALVVGLLFLTCTPWGLAASAMDLSKWNTSGWEQTEENGETVLTARRNSDTQGMDYYGTLAGVNSVEADMRYNKSNWVEAHSGFVFYTANGTEYYVDYRGDANGVRIRRNGVYMTWSNLFYQPGADEWMHWQVMWSDTTLYLKVAGEIVLKYNFSNMGDVFDDNVTFKFWEWGQPMSLKNIQMSTVTPEAWGYLDLEFKDDYSVSAFRTENAAAVYADGQMQVTVTGGGARITSPVIDVPVGDRYSAFLPVRNTLCVRLKNDTAADSLKVYFTSDRNPVFTEDTCKTFPIEPYSGYTTYFFNLSDVIYMGAAGESYKYINQVIGDSEGYLTGFRFELPENVTEGSVSIDAITFEREDPVYDYAGEITSCVADQTEKVITVTGRVDPAYAGKTVTVYESAVNNYNEGMTYPIHTEHDTLIVDIEKLATATAAADGSFQATIPLYNGDVSRLSSLFLVWVDGVKVSGHFAVENYLDFYEDASKTDIPTGVSVKITDAPFNAKGDAFTDDTKAIQAAIDYVATMGGGVVILPGDTSTQYGRRYVATNINLKSNIELRIEEGAMIWQSQREEDYDYSSNYFTQKPIYGHDNDREGVVWAHSINDNLPLIYIGGEYDRETDTWGAAIENVRITGGGTIRMVDTGGEQPDPHNYAWNSNICVGCANRIHIAPIFLWNADGVDVTDITIQRTNSWHLSSNSCQNVYLANNTLEQAACINSDSFGMCNTKNATILRNFVYGNDDGVTLSVAHEDKRAHVFYHIDYNRDNTTENIRIISNQIWNGLGVAFIPWGSGGEDLSRYTTKNILIYDNVLGGESCAIGSWPDNPMYGWSSYYSYNLDNGERDDWSPIQDVFIINNRLRKPYNLRQVQVTNLVIENTYYNEDPIGYYKSRAAINFLHGSFDRVIRSTMDANGFKDESDWLVGLANWSVTLGENGKAGTAIVRQDLKYSGYIQGEGQLYQGLFLRTGEYEFKIKTKLVSGQASIFVADTNGRVLASREVTASNDFTELTLSFDITENNVYRLGISHTGNAEDVVYLDDADVKRQGSAVLEDDYTLAEDPTYSFTDVNELKDFALHTNASGKLNISDGKLVPVGTGEFKAVLKGTNRKYSLISVDIYPGDSGVIDAGIYIGATEVGNGRDNIDAVGILIESNFEGWKDAGNRVDIVFGQFPSWTELDRVIVETGNGNNLFTDGQKEPLRLTVEIQEKLLIVTLSVIGNPERYVQTYFEYTGEKDLTAGMVGLRSNYSDSSFDNLSVVYTKTAPDPQPADMRVLQAAISGAEAIDLSKYTTDSGNVLKAALSSAKALTDANTQTEVDGAAQALSDAISALTLKPADPFTQDPQQPQTPDAGAPGWAIVALALVGAAVAAATVIALLRRKKT